MQVAPKVDQLLSQGLEPVRKCGLELTDVLRATGGGKEEECERTWEEGRCMAGPWIGQSGQRDARQSLHRG